MDLAQDAEQGIGAVGAHDVAVSFHLGPFAIHVDDVDDLGVGMVLAEQTDCLANCGGGEMVAEECDIVVGRRLSRLHGGFLRGERSDFMAGGRENVTAKLRQLKVQ